MNTTYILYAPEKAFFLPPSLQSPKDDSLGLHEGFIGLPLLRSTPA